MTRRVGVLGAGAWGSALAKIIADNGHQVTLWGRDGGLLEAIRESGENTRYLPGVPLPHLHRLEGDLARAIESAEILVVAVPSRGVRQVVNQITEFEGPVGTVTKGIEFETGLTMSGVLASELPRSVPVAVSGPNIAQEVALGMPAATVAASADRTVASEVQALLHRPTFRVYTTSDVLGVELGGALKNIIAIAAGVCDGMGFGDNTKSALLTRGLAEIRRLGIAVGARAETFHGLSGLGDLTVTCFSPQSRNRTFGERLVKGGALDGILAASRSVIEGVPTSKSAHRLAKKIGVETPVIDEVYQMLHEGKPLSEAVKSLLGRDSKEED